jgi:hypothetical protein
MTKVILILEGEKPISWNKMYSGLHWSNRKIEVDRVHMAVRGALDPDWPMFSGSVAITITAYFKNRRLQLDASNIAAKLYEDGLIGWLIKDDGSKYVKSMKTVTLIDRERPRVEIEVKAV